MTDDRPTFGAPTYLDLYLPTYQYAWRTTTTTTHLNLKRVEKRMAVIYHRIVYQFTPIA